MARQFWAVGMRPGDVYHHALNMSMFVGGCLLGAERLGATAVPASVMDTSRHLMMIQQFQPKYIWGAPSFVFHLGEKVREEGIGTL